MNTDDMRKAAEDAMSRLGKATPIESIDRFWCEVTPARILAMLEVIDAAKTVVTAYDPYERVARDFDVEILADALAKLEATP